ncbi:MAG: hypothetical protein ABI821_20875 [Pseudomonadota bacterium]
MNEASTGQLEFFRSRANSFARRLLSIAGLAAIPMSGAIAGALIDERHHLGLSNWRRACRAAGFSYSSLIVFTFELLPTAIIGLLLGGLMVQCVAFASREPRQAVNCFAAHAGCALAMPAGLALCALALPLPLMLSAEFGLTLLAASVVLRIRAPRRA